MIAAGSIAEFLLKIRQHLLEYPRIHGRGRMVLHVDGKLDAFTARAIGFSFCLGDLHIRAHWLLLLFDDSRLCCRLSVWLPVPLPWEPCPRIPLLVPAYWKS